MILRAEHVYAPIVDPFTAERRGLGPDAVRETAVAPLAALPALLHRNDFEGRAATLADLPAEGETIGETTAYVNDGRWVAMCGTPGCMAALVVSPEDPRYFCPVCWRGWYSVVFPSEGVVDMIEDALLLRPAPQTRHWVPPETVSDLHEQNREMLGHD